jgi:hypothetical protein
MQVNGAFHGTENTRVVTLTVIDYFWSGDVAPSTVCSHSVHNEMRNAYRHTMNVNKPKTMKTLFVNSPMHSVTQYTTEIHGSIFSHSKHKTHSSEHHHQGYIWNFDWL